MDSSLNPGVYSRVMGGLLDTATNVGRYYRSTPNPGVLDFIEQNHNGSLVQPGDAFRMSPSDYNDLGTISQHNVEAVPELGATFDDVMANRQAVRDRQADAIRNLPPVLTDQTAPETNQGVLANAQPSANRRDQTPMSFKPQGISDADLLIKMGGAGLSANHLGGTAAMGATINAYTGAKDADRSSLNAYNLAMAKADAKAKGKGKKTGNAGDLYGSIVVNDAIDRGLPMIDNFTAGLGGTMLSKIPGTAATDLSKLIDSVKANAGFDKLQAMREASPTGGALGQVSDKEIRFLQSVFGSLDQDQSPKQLKYNLELFRYVYNSMIHGEDGHSYSPPAGAEAMINEMRVAMKKDPIASSQQAAAGNLSAADAIVGIN